MHHSHYNEDQSISAVLGWYAVSALHDYAGLKKISRPIYKSLLSLFFMFPFLFREQPRCCWTRSSTPASWRTMCAHQGAPPSTPCTSWRAVASAASWSMQSRLRAFGHGETVAPVNQNHTSTLLPRAVSELFLPDGCSWAQKFPNNLSFHRVVDYFNFLVVCLIFFLIDLLFSL